MSILVVALAVIGLNLLDAFCTLRHLEAGAVEVNPIMRILLGISPLAFLIGKYVLGAGGVLGIVAQARHRAADVVLRFVLLPVYFAIGVYQVLLFAVV
jgi:Domain of unknown function (DUF5658)